MAQRIGSLFSCLALGLGVGCAETLETPSEDNVGLAVAALSICDEAVPADRNIDGIPAYKQCPESENAAIYSNNGVDTSITQVDKSWTRTQWSGGYQCTEFANRYLQYRWGVKWIPSGNAGEWCNTQPPASSGVVQTMTPVHGDIMVLAPGSCGAAQGTGHVNIIDVVNGEKLIAVEQNGARRGNYQLSCGKCFLHVVKNDGVPMPAMTGASAPAPTTPPAAGSGAATPEQPRRGERPSAGVAGAAAATPPRAAAGSPAVLPPPPASQPTLQPPAAATPVASTSSAAAAGSGAVTPLSNAVSTPSSSRAAAPAEGGCSVAAVSGSRSVSWPLAFGLTLLGGLGLRARRRQR